MSSGVRVNLKSCHAPMILSALVKASRENFFRWWRFIFQRLETPNYMPFMQSRRGSTNVQEILDSPSPNMQSSKTDLTYNIIAFCCAIWFLITGSIWVYFANLFLGYPVAIIGIYFWYKARKEGSRDTFHKIVLAVFVTGLLTSLGVLIGLLLTN